MSLYMYDAFIRVLLCVCMRVFIDTYLYVYMTCSCIVLVVVALPFESVIIVRCCKYVHRADSFCESRHRSPFQRRKIGGQKSIFYPKPTRYTQSKRSVFDKRVWWACDVSLIVENEVVWLLLDYLFGLFGWWTESRLTWRFEIVSECQKSG